MPSSVTRRQQIRTWLATDVYEDLLDALVYLENVDPYSHPLGPHGASMSRFVERAVCHELIRLRCLYDGRWCGTTAFGSAASRRRSVIGEQAPLKG